MDYLNFIADIRSEISHYPWLETLLALIVLVLFAALANFIAKRVIVRGIHYLVTKLKTSNQSIFAEHSIIRRLANVVPALVVMNGVTTIPHLSPKLIMFIQRGAQAFIFLTIALTISDGQCNGEENECLGTHLNKHDQLG